MDHGTFHRWREPVIFDVAHAGRLLSATLAFWNIDKSKVVERHEFNRIRSEAGLKIFSIHRRPTELQDKSFRPPPPGLTWIFSRLIDYI